MSPPGVLRLPLVNGGVLFIGRTTRSILHGPFQLHAQHDVSIVELNLTSVELAALHAALGELLEYQRKHINPGE